MDEITTVKNQVKFAGWISMVEECQNSGLSIRTWCKENNVCYKTYLYRLRRLRQMFLQGKRQTMRPLHLICCDTRLTRNVPYA